MNDSFGNRLTVTSQAACLFYDKAVDAYLHAWPGVLENIAAAVAQAPDFALPHALEALVLAARGQTAPARAALERAQACARQAAPREQSHIGLVGAITEGLGRDALSQVIDHAQRFPGDALAASTALGAYGLFGFSGRSDHDRARLAFVEALAPHYPDELPWLMAHRGWARIECGQVREGQAMAQRAITLRPDNGHNAHIVMHGFFESAEPAAALAFLQAWLPGYASGALMWGHLHWHAALAEIELGRLDAAVARLLGPMTDHLTLGPPFMGLVDTVALMWRLGLLGRGDLPWAMAQKHAEQHLPNGSNVFGELHLCMLAAARRDRGAALASLQRLEKINERGHGGAPAAMRFAQGLVALVDGDADRARELFSSCSVDAVCLGGSHAQRAVVEQTRDACRLPPLQ